ncbi:sensor histidine kinase [Paenibacillus sp. TRM 82003]|nr:sensor histidine kinase [Paenibacillus sp. TRM 82003]
MRRFSKPNLNHVKLRDKMLIVYFLCVLVPIVLTNVVFYTVTTNNIRNQKIEDIGITLEKAKNDMRSQFDVAHGISAVLNTDYFLNESLERHYDSPGEYVDAYHENIFWTVNKYTPAYNSVKNITIYTDNPTIISGGFVLSLTDEVRQAPWFQEIDANADPVIVRHGHLAPVGYEYVYSMIRKLNYTTENQNQWVKIVKIDIHPDAIRQVFSSLSLDGDVFLVDENNVIQYTNRRDIGWMFTETKYDASFLPSDVITFEERYAEAGLEGWRIVLAMSDESAFQELRKSRGFILYLAVTNVVLPTAIILWIVKSITSRLIRLLRHMKKVKTGSFETVAYSDDRDEIGQLTSEFNRMTLQIKTLIDDVYIADIQKKDLELKRNKAQLHALQSQINPHFLFNVLATIRTRSMMKNEEETARIIANLAKIFRKSLQWGKDWVTVRDEIDLVISFLEIQKYRFGDKLNYQIHVHESAYERTIPKMMLQPLVENASIHGIEPLKQDGAIDITVEHRDRSLYFTVKDNGVGIDKPSMDRLLRSLRNSEDMSESIGMKNVYYRLRMYYDGDADFEIASVPGQGTEIRIRIPDDGGMG